MLDAAAALFVDHGYGATLRDIADRAGIKAGSIYHHFDSKNELFLAVLDRGIQVMHEAFDRAGETTPAGHDSSERLNIHVRAHLGALFEHGPYTTAHVTAFFTAPEPIRVQAVAMRDGYEQRWNGLLAEILDAPRGRRLSLTRLLLFGSMNSSIEWFDAGGRTGLDNLAQLISDQFLHGASANQARPANRTGVGI